MSVRTDAIVVTSRAVAVIDAVVEHCAEHGLSVIRPEPGNFSFTYLDCSVRLRAVAGALHAEVEAPSENMLFFLKQEVIEHLEEIDAEAAQKLRWRHESHEGGCPPNFRLLETVARQEVMPGLLRVRLKGTDLAALAQDGIHVRLMLPADRSGPPVWPVVAANGGVIWPKGENLLHSRFVTIRTLRLEQNEVDIDIAAHDGGLVSEWASLPVNGDVVGVMGPSGDSMLPRMDGLLLIADLTGLPAIARLLETLNSPSDGHIIVSALNVEAARTYLPATSLEIHAIPPERFETEVVEADRSVGAREATRYAWFAGEFVNAQALRNVFKREFGLGKMEQLSVAYWRRGVPGHAAREV